MSAVSIPSDTPVPDLPHVRIETGGTVALATLVNRGRRNALTLGMWRELEAFAIAVSADPNVRVVLVRGEGPAFCAGADITAFATERHGSNAARLYDDQLEAACRSIEAIRQPTVARLEGPVVGAGAALAASCDLRLASDDAFFMIPAARLGLGFDPRGVARLARVFGEGAARALLLTADRLSVTHPVIAGALYAIHPAAALDGALEPLVARLSQNAPMTLAAAKIAVRAVAEGTEPTLMDEAWRLVDAADASADYVEGREAFFQKRPPRFEGR